MAIIETPRYEALLDDPDDYRPNSNIALAADIETADGDCVGDMCVLLENCAPGDRIPLHTHPIEEVILIEEGTADVRLGDERRTVRPGTVVFVPKGVPHGMDNAGRGVLRLRAVYSSTVVSLQYLERSPAPGTESDEPRYLSIDVRALAADQA